MGIDEVDRREHPAEEEDEDLDDLDAESLAGFDDEEELEDEGEESDDDSDPSESPVAAVEDDDSEQESLDELLDQRLASRLGPEGADDDDDVITLPTVPITTEVGGGGKSSPVKDRQEFVCNRCHLVKAKVQLADTARGLCRDCV